MSAQTNRNVAGTVIGVTMALVSGGIAGSSAPDVPEERVSVGAAQPANVRRAIDKLLSQLPVRDEPARRGYSRDKFPHWSDLDGDGCETRQQVLIDESEEGAIDGCEVKEGEWNSVYDDKSFSSPGGLDVDHVVALGEAWDSGASKWTTERRERYANDLEFDDALIAVSAGSNRSKSDKDPAEWKPPDQTVWCRYATAWSLVKIRWSLATDPVELDALRAMFRTCRSRPADSIDRAS